MAYCQWCIIESQMAQFRGYSFWICSGSEIKEAARQWLESSSLPLPEQVLKASIPSHQSDSCPNLSWGLWTQRNCCLPMSSQASSYPVLQRPGRLNPLCDLCSASSDPRARASVVGLNSKTRQIRVVFFISLPAITCFIFWESLSLKKLINNVFSQKFI